MEICRDFDATRDILRVRIFKISKFLNFKLLQRYETRYDKKKSC